VLPKEGWGPRASSLFVFSATAEILHPSGSAKTNAYSAIHDNDRDFALTLAVLQHLLHSLGIKFDIIKKVIRIRRTGAISIGSAFLAKDNGCAH